MASSPETDLYDASSPPEVSDITTPDTDKENHRSAKGKQRLATTSNSSSGRLMERSVNGKRRRNDDGEQSSARRRRTAEAEEDALEDSTATYDPEQDAGERRDLRKEYRELTRSINDHRSDYLTAGSVGLLKTLERADQLAAKLKQTSDAAIDSRLVVTTAELAYRKTVQLKLGDSALGVDVDEFVSKCMSLMRRHGQTLEAAAYPNGRTQQPQATQSRRATTSQDPDDEDNDNNDGDMLNWEALGRVVIQHNTRPAIPGFLLGPLSFTKRARRVIARKPQLKVSSLEQTQPTFLTSEDIHKSDNTNLTILCGRILAQLQKSTDQSQDAAEAEAADMTDMGVKEQRELFDKYSLTGTGAIDFFKFVVNPHSFAQTVENMFYVSFLIRDGKAGIEIDDDGMLGLQITQPREGSERTGKGVSKHQAILALGMADWQRVIDEFHLVEPMIPHREETITGPVNGRGWYS